jgi:hypothetical protein
MSKKLTEAEFIEKAKTVHRDKYDYSETKYQGKSVYIHYRCKIHHDNIITHKPESHLNGSGCPHCKPRPNSSNTTAFIKKAVAIYGDKYDYSKVEYVNQRTPVVIICKEHGEYKTKPVYHLDMSQCPECTRYGRHTTESFIKSAIKVHGTFYNYDNVDYKDSHSPIEIICPKHGVFSQTPTSHLTGNGCNSCSGKKPHTTESFIKKARERHGDRYDYSASIYENANTKISIICREHGPFLQRASNHINIGQGCPMCLNSAGERIICRYLEDRNIHYIMEHKFPDCRYILELPFDFYLPKHNTIIEYHGEQHYKPILYFGGEARYKERILRDSAKEDYCIANNIHLIIIPYTTPIDNIHKILDQFLK